MNRDKSRSTRTAAAISLTHVLMVTIFAVGFFGIVNPTPADLLVVIAGGVVLGLVFYAWFALLVRVFALFWPFSVRQQRILAVTLTFSVMFLVLMQSIGELSWRDPFAMIPLVSMLYAYTTYMMRERHEQGRPEH